MTVPLPASGDTTWYDWGQYVQTRVTTDLDGKVDAEQARDVVAAALRAGANVTITSDDAADTITISATDTNTTDPEVVRDTMAGALVAGTNVTITVDDAANTITIAASGGTGGTVSDATATTKGVVQLAGHLGGTAAAPTVTSGAGHTHTAAQVSDATATGRSVLTAADAAAARTAIGAGTSSLVIGTTATTAKAGDYAPPAATDAAQGIVELATTAEATTGTDTARAVTPAGLQAVADTKASATIAANTQTGTAYTLVAADAGKAVEMNNSAANTVTVPANVFTAGHIIEVFQLGAGQTTIAAGTGLTLRAPDGAKLAKQYASASLRFRTATEAVLAGNTIA